MIWKETYRGRAIYWHGKRGYGDETNYGFLTIKACRDYIDAILAEAAALTDADRYFVTLTPDEREAARRAYCRDAATFEAYASVAEFAFANKTLIQGLTQP